MHYNPVVAGIVEKPGDYLYSSARDYCGMPGLIDIILAEPLIQQYFKQSRAKICALRDNLPSEPRVAFARLAARHSRGRGADPAMTRFECMRSRNYLIISLYKANRQKCII